MDYFFVLSDFSHLLITVHFGVQVIFLYFCSVVWLLLHKIVIHLFNILNIVFNKAFKQQKSY